jgi:hypothetical protein
MGAAKLRLCHSPMIGYDLMFLVIGRLSWSRVTERHNFSKVEVTVRYPFAFISNGRPASLTSTVVTKTS